MTDVDLICLYTGQAGTGKTWTVRKIIDELEGQKKTLMICCSTGIATLPYLEVTEIKLKMLICVFTNK